MIQRLITCTAVFILVVSAVPSFAQTDIPQHFMIGGDLSLNFNFFSSDRMLLDTSLLPPYENDFLGSMDGVSFLGSIVGDFPMSINNGIALRATLEDIRLDKSDIVIIPCTEFSAAKQIVAKEPATTEQMQQVSLTYLTFGAEFYQLFGHVFGTLGSSIGPALASSYAFKSRIIEPDSCFFDYLSSNRSKTMHTEDEVSDLNFRIPISIHLGILIPLANRVYFAPSFGVNLGFYPINGSGSTVTSIQPAMGIRYMP